jgi:hypothetical protein
VYQRSRSKSVVICSTDCPARCSTLVNLAMATTAPSPKRATTADTATDHRIRSSPSRAAELVAAVLLTDRWSDLLG